MRRSKHNLSFTNLMTGDMGKLYPVGCVEVLAGDSFQHRTNVLVRSIPLLAPVMHSVTIGINHFFVPNRLVWPKEAAQEVGDNWEDFITGGNDGNNAATIPFITQDADPLTNNPLLEYFGIPPIPSLQVNSLAIRAFNMIFNEFYRDQDLVTARGLEETSIPNVAWNRDYFTAARPFTQRGDDVSVPIGGDAPIVGFGISGESGDGIAYPDVKESDGSEGEMTGWGLQAIGTATGVGETLGIIEATGVPGFPNMRADLSQATAASVNEFRLAFALQRYKEARARYGARYTEYLRYLGIRSSDSRLQRPEYLSGSRQTIAYSEILQTAPDDQGQETTFVGDLKGHGIAALRGNRYRRFFEEHGHVISLMFVRPKSIYQNMLEKKWSRTDKESYFQHELQQIGQQELLRKEIFAETGAGGETVFGFVDRYLEYKQEQSYVCGEYRTDFATSKDFWHFARNLDSAPALNADFINCVPTKRVYPIETNHVLNCSVQHSLIARRLVTAGNASRIL